MSLFSKTQGQSTLIFGKKPLTCVSCGLYKNANSPKMKPTGNFKKQIMLIGTAPSYYDDRDGVHWSDKYGQYLKKALKDIGVDLFDDCISINAINCHPGDKEPSPHEIGCCRRIVMKAIDNYQPKVIIALGTYALTTLIGHRWKKDLNTIEKWRGFVIPDQDLKAWVCPVYAPDFIIKNDAVADVLFRNDLLKIKAVISKPWQRLKKYEIDYITDLSVLDTITSSLVAIDYETTGIKPHAPGHQIVCVSIADTPDHAYVFMMPKSKKKRAPFIRLLANVFIAKTGQNIKFEETWSTIILGQSIANWEFDTQLASHQLDSRDGVTGLKFQTYINFGVIDYTSEVDEYLRSNDESGNAFNKVLELVQSAEGAKSLMKYCAQDTIYQYRLALIQIEKLNYTYLPF